MNGGFHPPAAGPGPAQAATVLLVDDQDAVRNLLSVVLTREGYRVTAAPTAEEALRLCSARPEAVHVLITDINLPGMSGPALAGALAGDYPDLKVLFLSGCRPDCGPTRLAGAAHFLQKPFQLAVFAAKVREVLAVGRASAPA